MELIRNVRIYGLEESFVASGYPMRTEPPTEKEFEELCKTVSDNDGTNKRVHKLASCPKGEGHDNFLKGIIVQFDLAFTVKAWTEAERYHFLDFVSSMSSMHRLSKMDFNTCFCEYVTDNTISEMKRLLNLYNDNPTPDNYLTLLYNCPVGLQLTARMTTNYQQLKTIYSQRRTHRLPEWRKYCEWIEILPYSELITGKEK